MEYICMRVCVKYSLLHGVPAMIIVTATQLFGFDGSSSLRSLVTISFLVTPSMGKAKTTFDISCCNKLGLCFVTFLQRKPSKHKHGGGGGVSPLMTLMMIIMIVTNWHEHSMLTLLARVFNTYQISTSIQRLPNLHERMTLN